MGITLTLQGMVCRKNRAPLALEAVREWLTRVAVWFEEVGDVVLDAQLGRDAEERPILRVFVHPAAEPIEVRLDSEGRVRASAITTPAGPGYHIWLCQLLRTMSQEFSFSWVLDDCRDDTSYFLRQDRKAAESAFLHWLVRECQNRPHSPGLRRDCEYTYPAEVLTPLGPRDRHWQERITQNPEAGTDFFPWWDADIHANFYRNRALVNLWCHYPWRPPLTESEGEQTDQIAADLATAFQLDPAAELPWVEWLEVLQHIHQDAADEHFCVTPDDRDLSIQLWRRAGPVPNLRQPPLGYRRYPVWVRLDGGWRVQIPGDFLWEWDEERNWTAWNRHRAIWFRRLGFHSGNGKVRSPQELLNFGRQTLLGEGEEIQGEAACGPDRLAVFGQVKEDERTLWRLMGVAVADEQLVLCNIYMQDSSDLSWAMDIWRSLQHQASREGR
ncbi:MAG: hypothetical protein KatS3mg107_0671 [Gemmataceae bacterium]|jgi:hypothetical protein|nr:MAG: hypothetical protein KatS3mg107_0671 [Gemmataceae bacterium]